MDKFDRMTKADALREANTCIAAWGMSFADARAASMDAHKVSPVRLEFASEAGALDAYVARCSCGIVISNTWETGAKRDAADHVNYWLKRQAPAMDVCAACGQTVLTTPDDPPQTLLCDVCLASLERRREVRRANAALNQGGLF